MELTLHSFFFFRYGRQAVQVSVLWGSVCEEVSRELVICALLDIGVALAAHMMMPPGPSSIGPALLVSSTLSKTLTSFCSDLLSRHVNKCHANEKPLVNTTTRRKGSASTSRATTSKQACDQCVQSSLPCDGSNPCCASYPSSIHRGFETDLPVQRNAFSASTGVRTSSSTAKPPQSGLATTRHGLQLPFPPSRRCRSRRC